MTFRTALEDTRALGHGSLIRGLAHIAMTIDPRATEIISMVSALGWAIAVALKVNGMDAFDLEQMPKVAPMALWAGVFSFVAAFQGVALAWNAAQARRFAALTAACTWGAIAALTLATVAGAPAGAVYSTLAVANAWAFGQVARTR